ncbi:MAG: hypothetical protein HUU16_02590 [Candidatus Omnitrophica bacterium]|nr:Xylulose kinase [bacterium]NUN95038.1 hypothetical protein [Candidatus Omnitrophota bacterium]
MKDAILAVDLGTSRIRSGVFLPDGSCTAVAARDYPILSPEEGAAEQEPLAWKSGFFETVREALEKAGALRIEGVCLSGQMHGTVLLDREQGLLGNAIIWCDQRGGKSVRSILEGVGRDRHGQITGNPLASGFQAATLAYLKVAQPERFNQIGAVLLPKDYLIRELTGEFVSEPTDAVSTGMLDLKFDTGGAPDWSEEVLAFLEVPRSGLPDLIPSLPSKGGANRPLTLSEEAARTCGLPGGLPVLAFGGDAVIGGELVVGEGTEGEAVGLVSSGGQLLVAGDRPFPDPGRGVHLLPRMEAGKWFSMAAFLAAGLSLEWWRSLLTGALGVEMRYENLLAEAARVPPGAEGLGFAPHIAGERTPLLDPEARGVFWGVSKAHGAGHFVRAILEGVAMSFRQGLEILDASGGPIRTFSLGGGGVKSPLWRQIFADVLNREVRTLSDIAETSLVGAAYCGARVLGWDLGGWRPARLEGHQPNPRAAREMERRYKEFLQVAPALQNIRRSGAGV